MLTNLRNGQSLDRSDIAQITMQSGMMDLSIYHRQTGRRTSRCSTTYAMGKKHV